jgi:hypothetical protein
MGCDKENVITAKKLRSGEKCIVQGFGQSMEPIIKSGQICEVLPVGEETVLEKNDIVFAKVHGHFYLHKISAIRGDEFQISNNHGHVNGWTGRDNIYGKVSRPEMAKLHTL